ncbi:hypothetical protein AVEN_214371-1 [Araneus ventricosus]|uniref:Uncharacterized protein n=1 Tax=Araneus ventricosus TaxID=182803 RepID=A0A4Y2HP63_ARAVE|nr:hypothetical protein AVEN_214371-1 [Araneus ventricosus]
MSLVEILERYPLGELVAVDKSFHHRYPNYDTRYNPYDVRSLKDPSIVLMHASMERFHAKMVGPLNLISSPELTNNGIYQRGIHSFRC